MNQQWRFGKKAGKASRCTRHEGALSEPGRRGQAARLLLVCLSLAGTGCAQATPSSAVTSTITIHAGHPRGTISPQIFGHFTEETLTSWEGGASSQLLADRKFSMPEARDPHAPMMTGTGGPWQPLVLAGNVTLVQDRETYYSAPMSQRITNFGGDAPAGVQQSGYRIVIPHISKDELMSDPFHFRTGEHYRARIAIKARDFNGDVHVALGASYKEPVAQHSIPVHAGDDWKVYEFDLLSKSDVADGKFMVYTETPGTIWIDSVSLVRSDLDDGGFRSDLIGATRKISPTNIRWPGGWFVSDYHWQHGIGPVDQRPAEVNRAWGAYYNNDVGVDEYLAFCQKVGATPYIVVNVGSGTAAEAAALVEYVNGSANTPWGKRRAENGHPAPYGVRLWNIGNEEYLPTLGGTSAGAYVKNYLEFAHAMKKVDPAIQLVAVGSFEIPRGAIPSSHPLFNVVRYIYGWSSTFLPAAGKEADYYAIHYYEPGDSIHSVIPEQQLNDASLTIAEDLSRKLEPVFHIMDVTKRHIPIALDEWSLKMPDNSPEDSRPKTPAGVKPEQMGLQGSALTLREALGEAGVYNMMQRRPNDFGLSSRTLLYAYQVGLIASSRDKVVLSPPALMLELFSTRERVESLDCDVASPVFDVAGVDGYVGVKGAKYLDVSARTAPGKREIEVFVVNRDLTHPLTAKIQIEGAATGEKVAAAVLNGSDLNQWNGFDSPDRVVIRNSDIKVEGGRAEWTFEPHSLTRLTFLTSSLTKN
jgi:alpha-L-arabinofuranosidase